MTLIALTAERGAGKTTFATAVARTLGARHMSVSRWLRDVLIEQGLEPSPGRLRSAGEQAARAPDVLVEDVLAHFGWTPGELAVFDAVRHYEVLRALRQRVRPERVLLVALAVTPEEVDRRLSARGDAADVAAGQDHSTERQVPSLMSSADLILDGATPLPLLIRTLDGVIQSLR